MSTNPIPGEQDIESTLGHLSKAELLSLIKRIVQLYPDLAGLIETAQQITLSQKPQRPPFNPAFYHRQVDEIFYTTDRNTWGSEGRAAGPLLRIVDIGNDYVKQQDYTDAATLYEIIIRGILDNYDSFRWHPYEGDLDDVVEECAEGLGRCLRGDQDDAAVCKQIIQTLYDVYDFDSSLENDEPVMSSRVPAMLVRWTTLEERLMIATWVREAFDLDIDFAAVAHYRASDRNCP